MTELSNYSMQIITFAPKLKLNTKTHNPKAL